MPIRRPSGQPIERKWLVAPLVVAFACHACGGATLPPPVVKTAQIAPVIAAPPTVEQLKNMAYAGLDERMGPVTLANGRWTGSPPVWGGASRPIVELADNFHVAGDLDGDGLDDAVVVLTYRQGGTATMSFLAAVTHRNGILRNTATTALGDRVQVRSVGISSGRVIVRTVRAGPKDAACCRISSFRWSSATMG